MILWVMISGQAWLLCNHTAFLMRLQSDTGRDCNHLKMLTHLGTPKMACPHGWQWMLAVTRRSFQQDFLRGVRPYVEAGFPRASIPREGRNGVVFSDPAEEVTQRHFYHTQLVKALTNPSCFRGRCGGLFLSMRGCQRMSGSSFMSATGT